MSKYDELVKALREYSGCRKGEIARITSDAAAAIEALQAELEKSRDEMRKELLAEYWRKYRKENPELIAEIQRRYRERHREKLNKYHREYRAAHPEKVRAYNEARKSKRGVGTDCRAR